MPRKPLMLTKGAESDLKVEIVEEWRDAPEEHQSPSEQVVKLRKRKTRESQSIEKSNDLASDCDRISEKLQIQITKLAELFKSTSSAIQEILLEAEKTRNEAVDQQDVLAKRIQKIQDYQKGFIESVNKDF